MSRSIARQLHRSKMRFPPGGPVWRYAKYIKQIVDMCHMLLLIFWPVLSMCNCPSFCIWLLTSTIKVNIRPYLRACSLIPSKIPNYNLGSLEWLHGVPTEGTDPQDSLVKKLNGCFPKNNWFVASICLSVSTIEMGWWSLMTFIFFQMVGNCEAINRIQGTYDQKSCICPLNTKVSFFFFVYWHHPILFETGRP